ncbi:hypothetical protein [Aidingimonas halophila]|uniref:Glycosyl transferase n=1 Tax=Aidingimonas halophila TaxID=574349 RepID=A0A1H3GS05_9GAMM|nr:hypothetical protein [Aidingimonas halophila]GHC35882.1 hypothetical protein GCM10008094_31350 [Aidingimonas halophila]SDY06116.1 hypothetical protein SAMN05443545_11041 [Aidingimonas halophila]
MDSLLGILGWASTSSSPWNDTAPVRDELFSIERLEQHAGSLASAQCVTDTPPRVLPLARRLEDNAKVLLAAYHASAAEVAEGRDIVPAAAWLLDNYHLIEAQIREIRGDLPPGYYRQLPKLGTGPLAGYPRVFGVAWAFIAHTDSHLNPDNLRGFIAAYQRVQPLTIGELWAVAITLRIVLVENLRRLADQMISEQAARNDADTLATRWLVPEGERSSLDAKTWMRGMSPLAGPFVAQLAKRLRGLDPGYISLVDSGSLAGHLLVVANACEVWSEAELLSDPSPGIADNLRLVRDTLRTVPMSHDADVAALKERLDEIEARLKGDTLFADWLPALKRFVDQTTRMVHDTLRDVEASWAEELLFWIGALRKSVAEHCRDRKTFGKAASLFRLQARYRQVADTARRMALEMDFTFLFDPERQLLSIDYSMDDNSLDGSCYDLLAFEARLASLLAIAKGDVPTRHWFRLSMIERAYQ